MNMVHEDCKGFAQLVLPEEPYMLLEAIERVAAALSVLEDKLARPFLPWQKWTRHILLEMEAEYLEEHMRLVLALDRLRQRGEYDGPRFF